MLLTIQKKDQCWCSFLLFSISLAQRQQFLDYMQHKNRKKLIQQNIICSIFIFYKRIHVRVRRTYMKTWLFQKKFLGFNVQSHVFFSLNDFFSILVAYVGRQCGVRTINVMNVFLWLGVYMLIVISNQASPFFVYISVICM